MIPQGIDNALYDLNVTSIGSQDNDQPINAVLLHTSLLYRGAHNVIDTADKRATER